MTLVRDAMIQVPALSATDPIFLALRAMREQKVPFVPVVRSDGSLYGLVTEGDLIRLIYRATREQSDTVPRWIRGAGRDLLQFQSLREVVTRQLDTVAPDLSLEEAAELMFSHNRKVLPVVVDGKPVGYLTRTAIIDHLIG
ncbi:CBS domain-containing protein [Symbiobacterium terraclitae]|jgi:CBS domain-containing protein|uniref:CBS domain-containing protein n=1 Tax=Symbiobacterium terraclitae TaxID=557451 RepID=A0ABS4JTM5_9FIRM|nr:CBS domain-containing protein [Symbiobacterium terraclitae]MBP2018880.1 CBS domain-containing protein [Symbiobacterium terraclitae]